MKQPPFTIEAQQIAAAAAEWYFRLKDYPSTDNQIACNRWRAADPRHEQAWQKAEYISQQMACLPAELAMPVLADRDRRKTVKSLALLLCAPVAGWMAWQAAPTDIWLADQRTAVGERKQLTLADGTRLYLNTDTAVDIHFTQDARLINLKAGEILIETAPDSQIPARPFRVQTRQGYVTPIGTRFSLRDYSSHTQLAVFEGEVEIETAMGKTRLEAGKQTRFSTKGFGSSRELNVHAADWSEGMLVVRNMPLVDFLAELGRYRPGLLRCSPEIAQLQISGVYQLQNIDSILAGLPAALPVQVVYRSRYWVTLIPAQ